MTTTQKQRQLQFLGYYKGTIDGKWGTQSVEATKKFQSENGLVVDGKFGAKTEEKTMQLVIDIQRKIGANVDGLVGSETIAKYNAWKKNEPQTDWWSEIKYFKRSEFKCKCGGKYCNGFPVEPQKNLVQAADKVREHFGVPVRISSGIRCHQHNANQKNSAPNSRHKQGKAVDFCVTGRTANTVLNYVKKMPEIRYAYAIDGSYVHMDVE